MELTEQKILDAAQKIFQEKGFHGARMQEIANEAGINKAALHYYYRSKLKLFQQVFENVFSEVFPKISSILNSKEDFWVKVDLLIDSYIEYFSKHSHLLQFVLTELHTNSEIIDQILEKQTQKLPIFEFVKEIQQEIKKGTIRAIHPLHFILNIVSMAAFPFLAKNLIGKIAPVNQEQMDLILNGRKEQVKQFVRSAMRIEKQD